MKEFSVLILQVFYLYFEFCLACRVSELKKMSVKLIDTALSFFIVKVKKRKKRKKDKHGKYYYCPVKLQKKYYYY